MTKDINNMTIEEMKNEIKKNKCNYEEGYVFISYSHKDANIVYPKVIEWMRQGYNIYIDTDFENHGSDQNWVSIMEKAIRNNVCNFAVCFKSKNYICSYAALIELLTMRMQTIKNKRNGADNKELPLDIIEIDNKCQEFRFEDEKAIYKEYFQGLKQTMGATFCKNNNIEKKQLEQGIKEWIESLCESKLNMLKYTAEDKIRSIDDNYLDGFVNFYPEIATTMLDWFNFCDLNGNTKGIETDLTGRFNELKVYKNIERQSKNEVVNAKEQISEIDKENEITLENNEKNIADVESNATIKKKAYSVTGDIKFLLYGKERTGNQSDLMIYTFYEVLKRHANIIDDVINGFTCASDVDYKESQNITSEMPSYFRVCETFQIENRNICIGTAYGLDDKLKLMAKLITLADESYDILEMEGIELPEVRVRKRRDEVATNSEKGSSGIKYWIFGKEMRGNQSNMMWDIFEKLAEKYPDRIERLTELLSVANVNDVIEPNSKNAKPTYFRGCRMFQVGDRQYFVGTSFGKEAKYTQIQKMIRLCSAPVDVFRVENEEQIEIENTVKAKRVFD